MCDRLAFMEMTDAEKAAVIADYAWMSRQFADRRADERARAERYARPLSPLVAAPDLPPVAHPLERAAASTLSTATRSGQVTPSPADTAARGDLIEDLA